MNAVLKHSELPRSRCFQIENTVSKLEKKRRNRLHNGIINSYLGYYHAYVFLNFAHTFGHGTET